MTRDSELEDCSQLVRLFDYSAIESLAIVVSCSKLKLLEYNVIASLTIVVSCSKLVIV